MVSLLPSLNQEHPAFTITAALAFVLTLALAFLLSSYKTSKKRKLPPGPTPWPILGNLLDLSDPPYRKMAELSKKYGPLMSLRLGYKSAVVVSSPEMAKEILQIHDKSCASRPPTISSEIISDNGHNIVLAPYGPFWRKARKFANLHLLTTNRLKSWLARRISAIQEMSDFFAKEATLNDGVVEVRPILSQGTMNTIMLMVAGQSYSFAFSDEPPKEGDRLMGLVREILEPFSELNPSDYIPLLSYLDPLKVEKRSRIVADKFLQYFIKLIDERLKEREERSIEESYEKKDFLDALLDLKGDDAFSKIEMSRLFQDMFVAGTDTSALTVEWVLAELLSHPDKMKILVDELQSIEISPQTDFSKLPYLQAVIKETLRLHSTGPLLLPHQTIEDIVINGYSIPKETIIFVNVWAISHDPNVWPEPTAFLPDRFLENDVDIRGFDFRFLPFGSGRRMCPGMNLGYSAVEIILAVLLKRFHWSLPDGVSKLDMSEKFTTTMMLSKPLKAHIAEIV